MGVGESAGNKDARPAQTRKTMRKGRAPLYLQILLAFSRRIPPPPGGGWAGFLLCVCTHSNRETTHTRTEMERTLTMYLTS